MARTERIEIRLTVEELAQIKVQASKVQRSVSDFVRLRALAGASVLLPEEETRVPPREIENPASSRAPSPEVDLSEKIKELDAQGPASDWVLGKREDVPMFKCPMPGCTFRAKSPAARCGPHGRTVVPEPV